MKIKDIEIDYNNLIFSKRIEIDKEAYSRYFDDNFYDRNSELYSYNKFYGTMLHKKYANNILREMKMKQIINNIK